ncbi:MAG: glycosyl transferase family 2 [Ruminococcaceae bacterium]|nr:glycosyl transferase family 2 [Oscillospiraceae bacterium]
MYARLHDVLSGQEANYMLPFYWQHGDHYETIPEEVERIYASGARALCVESRPHKDFCGETWWRDMDLILEESKKRGMKVWILDDDHFPTGHAVGHIAKYHPELRPWQLIERHVDVMGPLKDAMLTVEEKDGQHLICAYAYPRTGVGEVCENRPVCLTGNVKGHFLHFSLPEGCWRVFFLFKTREGSRHPDYIDMLNPESVRVLIDAVYEPHFAHYADYFGSTIVGFFSDEPSLGNDWYRTHSRDLGMYNRRVGMPGLALPWNDAIPDMMTASLGFDAAACLPALWFEQEGVTEIVRHAYMDAVTKLYRDCFTRQLGDWCLAHGVQYIGHIIEDMNAHARLGCSAGHYFRALDGQHMSGMDIVLHQIIPGMSDYIHSASSFGCDADPAFFDYVLAKLASSYAHIGTQMEGRAMCEVFGAYGWAEGTPVMKWLLDYLLVRGVNHFVPHAFSPAFPDPDCPPHFGVKGFDPQFEGYSRLMKYANCVSHLLTGGTHRADAAILYHADAEWMNLDGNAMLTQVPAKLLYDAHIDFDILPADCFTDDSGSRVFPARVENGCLCVGKQIYRVLIVPAAVVLPAKLEQALAALQSAGLPVIRLGVDAEPASLLSALEELFVPDITVEGAYPKLRICHYTADDAEVYMFSNESVTDGVDTTVTLTGACGTAVMLDLLNDSVCAVSAPDGRLALTLAPRQSVIAVFDRDAAASLPAVKNWTASSAPAFSFRIETAPYTDMEHFTLYAENVSADALFSLTGIDHMPEFSGRVRYTCTFDRADAPAAARLALDLGEVGQTSHLWCNGIDLGTRVCTPYRYELTDALRDGKNELVIEVSNTLANAIRDRFSAYLAIPATGLTGGMRWMV